MEIVHFAWLFETQSFCGKELKDEDQRATPLVIALNEGCELCEECLRIERTDAPQPQYDLTFPPLYPLLW